MSNFTKTGDSTNRVSGEKKGAKGGRVGGQA